MRRLDQESTPNPVFDPMADLFFSVVAIVVLAVIIILPTVRLEASRAPATKSPPEFEIDGRIATSIRATASGVHFGPDEKSDVALNAIDDDPSLAAALARARQAEAPLLVLIEPEGDEAAFQLEPVLARAGLVSVTQVRLDPSCSHMRGRGSSPLCAVPANVDRAP